MTKYTADDHALPYPEGGDRVAAHSDIQALALKTGLAISVEGSRAVEAAETYTDSQTEAIRDHFQTSHIALDTDGVPFFSPGSMSVQVHQDTDGVPYFTEAA